MFAHVVPTVFQAPRWRAVALVLVVALGAGAAATHQDTAAVNGFEAMIAEAVARMHSAMHIPFTGDPDRDFARMMIPHHQGAIDMAIAELRYGKDERLKRLAQEIVVEQQQEIAVMHRALGDLLPQGTAAPTQVPQQRKEQ